MIRNLEEFKKGAFVIHCSQREEAKKLLETLRNAGISWATSETIGGEVLGYEDYGDEVCYMMDNGGLYYAGLDYAQTWGKVVEYNDIFEKEYQLIDLLENPGILYSIKGEAQGPLYKYDSTLDKVVCSWDGEGNFCNPIYSMLGLAKSVFIREEVLPEVPEEVMVPAEQCTDIPETEPTVGLSELFKNPDKLYKYKDNYYKYDLDDDAILTSGSKDGLFSNTALTFKALNELEFQEFVERKCTFEEIIAMKTQPRVRLSHELFEEALDTPLGCSSHEELTVQHYNRYIDGGYLYINNIMALVSWFCAPEDIATIFKEGKFIIEENE